MLPYINIFGIKIYSIAIGIILATLGFLYTVRFFAKRKGLAFNIFFSKFYIFLLLTYFFGRYIQGILADGIFLPINPSELLYTLMPSDYKFHFVGLSVGFLIATIIFLTKVEKKNVLKRVDILFDASSVFVMILGIFLLLSDNFIGRQVDSAIAVNSIFVDSVSYNLGKIYPSGLFLSVGAGLVYFLVNIFSSKNEKNPGLGLLGFIGLIIVYNIVLYFTSYVKFFPLKIGPSTSIDINAYWSSVLIVIIFGIWLITKNGKNKSSILT